MTTFAEIFEEALKEVSFYKNIFIFRENDNFEGIEFERPHDAIDKISGFITALAPRADGNFDDIRHGNRFFFTGSSSSSEYSVRKYKSQFKDIEYKVDLLFKSYGSMSRYVITLHTLNIKTLKVVFYNKMTIYDLFHHFLLFKRSNEHNFFE